MQSEVMTSKEEIKLEKLKHIIEQNFLFLKCVVNSSPHHLQYLIIICCSDFLFLLSNLIPFLPSCHGFQ